MAASPKYPSEVLFHHIVVGARQPLRHPMTIRTFPEHSGALLATLPAIRLPTGLDAPSRPCLYPHADEILDGSDEASTSTRTPDRRRTYSEAHRELRQADLPEPLRRDRTQLLTLGSSLVSTRTSSCWSET